MNLMATLSARTLHCLEAPCASSSARAPSHQDPINFLRGAGDLLFSKSAEAGFNGHVTPSSSRTTRKKQTLRATMPRRRTTKTGTGKGRRPRSTAQGPKHGNEPWTKDQVLWPLAPPFECDPRISLLTASDNVPHGSARYGYCSWSHCKDPRSHWASMSSPRNANV